MRAVPYSKPCRGTPTNTCDFRRSAPCRFATLWRRSITSNPRPSSTSAVGRASSQPACWIYGRGRPDHRNRLFSTNDRASQKAGGFRQHRLRIGRRPRLAILRACRSRVFERLLPLDRGSSPTLRPPGAAAGGGRRPRFSGSSESHRALAHHPQRALLERLPSNEHDEFLSEFGTMLRETYPARDGMTLFPRSRGRSSSRATTNVAFSGLMFWVPPVTYWCSILSAVVR